MTSETFLNAGLDAAFPGGFLFTILASPSHCQMETRKKQSSFFNLWPDKLKRKRKKSDIWQYVTYVTNVINRHGLRCIPHFERGFSPCRFDGNINRERGEQRGRRERMMYSETVSRGALVRMARQAPIFGCNRMQMCINPNLSTVTLSADLMLLSTYVAESRQSTKATQNHNRDSKDFNWRH